MKDRFEGEKGGVLLLDAMQRQKALTFAPDLAKSFIELGHVVDFVTNENMIAEGDKDTDVFFILVGAFDLKVGGRRRGVRRGGDLVGEMVGLDPTKVRMATLTAKEPSAALRVSAADFVRLSKDHAGFWRGLQEQTSDRLRQQHARGGEAVEKPNVLIFSSTEDRDVMGQILINLEGTKQMTVEAWDGIFSLSSYPINALIDALRRADFALAIAGAEDTVVSRHKQSKVPRDNINFEYGLAVGVLGLDRALLMVEGKKGLKLPSDLGGLTVLPFEKGTPVSTKSSLRAASEKVRMHVANYGIRPD